MENKITIAYLNNKIWYRALKVMYTFFVILCYLIAISGIVLHFNYISQERNQYSKEQENKEKRLMDIQKMQDLGYTTKQIVDSSPFSKYGQIILSREEYKKIYGEEVNLPSAQSNSEKPASYLWLILFIPLYLVIALIISEIPKRIFYYVALGNIRPEK